MLYLLQVVIQTTISICFAISVQHKFQVFNYKNILKSEDFFRLLQENGIRKKATEHENLKSFLQLSAGFPNLLVLKSIRKTLEQMAENEEFMDAIREDI